MITTFTPSVIELIDRVRKAVPKNREIYLVGGAIRDVLLARSSHDLDFVLPEKAIETGRYIANKLGAAFYPLDLERDAARLILPDTEGKRIILDFSAFRGTDIENDLKDRDFTINAMALNIKHPSKLIDPLGGVNDLKAGIIRPCNVNSFLNDPVRILRAVRLAAANKYKIIPETRQLLRQSVSLIPNVSVERLRDELFRILEGPHPATALRSMDVLGILPYVLPELSDLKNVHQSPPHQVDAWEHTLDVVLNLTNILDVLDLEFDEERFANWTLGLISLKLGRYRKQLGEHYRIQLNTDRCSRSLLILAAIYHDIAKPETTSIDSDGKITFYEHEKLGSEIIHQRARYLRLSNQEVNWLESVVRDHMRPLWLSQSDSLPTRRAIYRFFRDTQDAGIDICLLALADTLGTYRNTLPKDVWIHQLEVTREIMDAWWDKHEEVITPPPLLTGQDLMKQFNLNSGPRIGKILEAIREAQACGEIDTLEAALAFAGTLLNEN